MDTAEPPGWTTFGGVLRWQPRNSPIAAGWPEEPLHKKLPRAYAAWLEQFDFELVDGRPEKPQQSSDYRQWDRWWRIRLRDWEIGGSIPDMLSLLPLLPFLARRGARTILCAGNGFSLEPIALAFLGFHVTALDLSGEPELFFRESWADPEYDRYRIAGASVDSSGILRVPDAGPLSSALGPHPEWPADLPGQGGGSVSVVCGDLTDPTDCPGPFDVVIERRCVWNFTEDEPIVAYDRLAARLATPGVLVSEHGPDWYPGGPGTFHFAEAWAEDRDFKIWTGPGHDDELVDESPVVALQWSD